VKLYSYFRSSAAFRIRIALQLKGLEYDYIAVNLLKSEQKSASYLAKNPQGLLPALELDSGQTLSQSVALLEWLEECHPQPPLLPLDALQRARVRSVVNSITCDVHPLCNMAVTTYLKARYEANQQDIMHWYHTWMQRGFNAIEKVLAENNTRCAFGNEPSMADICIVPQVYNARRFNIDLAPFPHLVRVADYCRSLPAFSTASPENQPDSND
jgi:maleylacetoacetate isomerase